MPTAILTRKGQITIPVAVRNDLKVDAGDPVKFVQIAPRRYESVAATHGVQGPKRSFGKPARSVSTDDMNKAIARRASPAR